MSVGQEHALRCQLHECCVSLFALPACFTCHQSAPCSVQPITQSFLALCANICVIACTTALAGPLESAAGRGHGHRLSDLTRARCTTLVPLRHGTPSIPLKE